MITVPTTYLPYFKRHRSDCWIDHINLADPIPNNRLPLSEVPLLNTYPGTYPQEYEEDQGGHTEQNFGPETEDRKRHIKARGEPWTRYLNSGPEYHTDSDSVYYNLGDHSNKEKTDYFHNISAYLQLLFKTEPSASSVTSPSVQSPAPITVVLPTRVPHGYRLTRGFRAMGQPGMGTGYQFLTWLEPVPVGRLPMGMK